MSGRLGENLARPGQRVLAGEEVGRVDPIDLDAQLAASQAAADAAEAEALSAEVDLRTAQERRARVQSVPDLFSAEARSLAVAGEETAQRAAEAARARAEQARAELRQLRSQAGATVLRAPSNGWVANRLRDPGALVEAGEPILRLIGGDDYLVRFAVPPAEALSFQPGQRVHGTFEATRSPFAATVARVAAEVDPSSQLVFVEAELDDVSRLAGNLKAGLVLRILAH